MILGVVLAGGKSTRFGSDKALAELGGQSLLARAVEQLGKNCDKVIVAGRKKAPADVVPDWPAPDTGPLGGIAAALNYALEHGYENVLTSGVDTLGLPDDIVERLSPAPRYVEAQPIVGLWPAKSSGALEELQFSGAKQSMRAFAERIRAKAVKLPSIPANINTPADLAAAEKNYGL